MKENNSNLSALKWIIKNTKSQHYKFFFLILINGLYAYLGVYNTLIAKDIIDSATSQNYNGILYNAVIFGLYTVLLLILKAVSGKLWFTSAALLEFKMKSNLFNKIIKKDYSSISHYHSGELLNRIVNDVSVISNTITSILPNVTYLLVKLIGVFIVLWSMDKRFAVILFVFGIFIYVFSFFFKKYMKKLHKEVQETEGKTRSFIQEMLVNLLVVKIFSAEKKVTGKLDEFQYKNYTAAKKRNNISVNTMSAFSFVFCAAYLYGLVWGAFGIHNGIITYGSLVAVLTLISQIQTPIQQATNVLPLYYRAIASAERIIEIEEIKDEDNLKSINNNCDVYKIYDEITKLNFKNVSFKYDRENIFNSADLTLEKGDFAVITGESGIGKSTLLKLLLGVYTPQSGTIYFEGNNKKVIPIDNSMRKMFAYVPQGNFILSGTIKENILFTKDDATQEEIAQAIKVSCCDTFINNLPGGLNTQIGEKGIGLSEGQVQRIAIARAIISSAPILIFDESTSALDSNTEKKLLSNIKNLNNKTCLIVSHKNAALLVCNKEIIINDNRIDVLELKQ